MNALVIGGTRFLGRHIVEWLAAAGHRVVCFHRGKTAAPLPDGVEERHGDRDTDLSAVASERWDAIVDTCCFRPEQLHRSLELHTNRYLFVSTVNVYNDQSVPGVSESAATIEAFDPSDESRSYGGNKAACERLLPVQNAEQCVILRPGLIAGRWDPTGRFTYWCERLLRGGHVLAPGEPDRRVQFIDAADIAAFCERAIVEGLSGAFNMVGPAEPMTMAELLDACAQVAAERGAPPATVVWARENFLLEQGVQQWTEMPLWLTDAQYAGILEVSNAKGLAAGLRTRPVVETVRAVLDWTAAEANVNRVGMAPQREAELLEVLGARSP